MSSILITGGTGTIGSAVAERCLAGSRFDRIVVFSRDEHKQALMRRRLDDPRLRFFLGDVRDASRISRACEGVDTIVHAAALKMIESGETDPIEVVRTNVDGTANVIDAALNNNVRRVVAISTDKAVEPICLYGATKLVMEGLVLHAKAYVGHRRTSFAVCRMGNIAHSRGSVIPYFNELAKVGKSLPVTDPEMTRYWMSRGQACDLIQWAVDDEAEVYTPKPIAFRLRDLVEAYGLPWHLIGLRPNERMYEKLHSRCSSNEPSRFMTVDELREAIRAG